MEKQILTDEIQDTELLEFAIENISELFSYIAQGNLNIRDIEGKCGLMCDGLRLLRICRILKFNLFKPRIFPRWLVKVSVNTNISVHILIFEE